MPFQKVLPEKVASAVVRQIEVLILRGVLRPGARLPSERDLAARLDVSRPSLRAALAELEADGLIETRPGAGGYVAAGLAAAFPGPLARLFARHEDALYDYLTFRRDLEGLAAERAARAGGDTDLAVIDTLFRRMEDAAERGSPREEADLDAEFHMAIVEAAHNMVLVHMMRAMFELLQAGVFYNRRSMFAARTTRAQLLAQHRAIRDAVVGREPAAARAAVEAHLGFVERILAERGAAARHEATARLRLTQASGR